MKANLQMAEGLVMDVALGFAALNSALDILKTVKEINDRTARLAAVNELHEKLNAAHAAYQDVARSYGTLEKELAAMKAWENEAMRYELHDYGGGTFAYTCKEAYRGTEPPHRICANCYVKAEKSILQFSHRSDDGNEYWDCLRCGTSFRLGARDGRSSFMSRSVT